MGLDGNIGGGTFHDNTGFLLAPVLTAEPRLYYNLDKRIAKGKDIKYNSGNFVSIKLSHHPDWFVISNYRDIRIISDISFVPTIGLRRNWGEHFNYETGLGFGFRYVFAKNAGYSSNQSESALNLHLRIGYRF